MGFPCVSGVEVLTRQDFFRFELPFIETLLDFFPGAEVRFVTEGLAGETPEPPSELDLRTRDGVIAAGLGRQPLTDVVDNTLFLPFDGGYSERSQKAQGEPLVSGPELLAVAVLKGGDGYAEAAEDWLRERWRLVGREFLLIKRWAYDPISGVLNANHLRHELGLLLRSFASAQDNSAGTSGGDLPAWRLLLIEVSVRPVNAGQTLGHISRIAAYLDSLLGEITPIYHLGAGVFALVWPGADREEAQKLGASLLGKLKRQSTHKVRIGIAACPRAGVSTLAANGGVDGVLDEAWQALVTARQRGAFALCLAADDQADEHLLAPLPSEVVGQMKRLWQGENQFSILFLQRDLLATEAAPGLAEEFPQRVRALVGEGAELHALDGRRALILLPGTDEDSAAEWACGLANRLIPLGIGTFSMGIASYPCPGFRKGDIPMNAKKALLHAQFFGAGSITSFSGVSLNISGDVYYNEGDLVSAIREYRLGLNLNPDNVNLLNSLGVIYAQIDAHAKAIALFEKAIGLDPADFMARCNLGLAQLSHGEVEQALSCFEQAEKIDDSYFDLLLQLGQLYCQRGKYKAAVRVLAKVEKQVKRGSDAPEKTPWQRCELGSRDRQELGYGLVYRYLGEAYKGIGQNREAMTYLQRAARYNSRDSEALSQLGEMYAEEQQGLDIALAFCRQAVEIEGGKASHWYRMAKVLLCRQEWPQALEAVGHCLSLDGQNLDALMLKAALHERDGQQPLARAAYERVLALDGTHAQAAKALKKMNQRRR